MPKDNFQRLGWPDLFSVHILDYCMFIPAQSTPHPALSGPWAPASAPRIPQAVLTTHLGAAYPSRAQDISTEAPLPKGVTL
ncbi:serine/threonine-protein phosphatase 4 regulatory subunit 1 isoform X1 [Clarias magur]|uniref:Serine/threonine-protein phosphatase 4 regulatory subunit 1 isoform X1 n=1 Tax=Clarias magur TaxID=1594786 RepID=A0A8J4T5T0_CLAMG|nr:serine/threonine-protein phosphatase 4 regulatory subunit 1 isoform X1 [Clarias magur]